MKPVHDATPLIAVDAIAFDTETTGLDVREARILQLGAMALQRGVLNPGAIFDRLVDPGIAIPPRSTEVHGINEQMVRTAPSFASAWQEFEAFRAGRLLIGYALGFDLAILEREAERLGHLWKAPRSLCVRMLAGLANPQLPDNSLDAIAAWLEIDVEGRHDAVADARIAGEVFVKLVPHLTARNIRTLAEAELACSKLTNALDQQQNAGWNEPFVRPGTSGRAGALGTVDPYAFSHRVHEAMSAPPMVARNDMTALEAVGIMTNRGVSSLFLSNDGTVGQPIADYAIVTERDVMRAIAAEGSTALEKPVSGIASRPVEAVSEDDYVYRAIGAMAHRKVRHLAVVNGEGALCGAVSARDFLKLRSSVALEMETLIDAAESPSEMAEAWSKLPAVASSLLADEVDARTIADIISAELRALTARACHLATEKMQADGRGEAPCPYAVMVLGSGGRGESMLAADQDNAVIFAEGEPDGETDRWFADFGVHFADFLNAAAVPLCKGGVMARNPEWRGSVATWYKRIDEWVGKARPQDLLNVDIFYDLRHAHGDTDLVTDLRKHALDRGAERVEFAKLLGESVRTVANPFTLFGGIRAEEGRIDLKMHGLFPIVSLARALAIRHHVDAVSTPARLVGLVALGDMPENDLNALREAHAFLLTIMLEQQARDVAEGIPVSNRVEIAALGHRGQAMLKEVLTTVQRIPDLVRVAMFR